MNIKQMPTILYSSPVFGPVKSRRLGISLGVNLMPPDGKLCSFDCIYCECGFNADRRPTLPRPSREEVREALRSKLEEMLGKEALPDVITFAGNGEPTLHPDFAAIIDETIALRDEYCPEAKVSVLSNATTVIRQGVRDALIRVDNNIQKLDTVNEEYIRCVDRPSGRYDVKGIIDSLKKFKGHVIIQTMFLRGTFEGKDVSNTSEVFIQSWLDAIKEIAPEMVMIYTIDRETPTAGLMKASREELDGIARQVEKVGLKVCVSY